MYTLYLILIKFKFKSYIIIIAMGNKVLGKRSRSFYKGFNQRQIQYLKQKFEMTSIAGKLDKKKFMQAYKVPQGISDKFLSQIDFDEADGIDEYEFICMVHSLCSQSIQELGGFFFRIITKNKAQLNEKCLLLFTKTCLEYNAYLQKTKVDEKQIAKINKNKFEKYDFDHNKTFDLSQFTKICLKDEDYKKWMYNMGFISKRQMEFQQDVYDLVDSDIGDQVDRLDKQNNQNVSKIKQGIQHRLDDDQFQVQQVAGEQSIPEVKPWVKQTKEVKISVQNLQPPNQSLQIDYVFGYRSFDCRNNLKFDSKGRVIYHQAALGIVLQPASNKQSFLIQHHDDVTCLDVVGDTVVSGQTGSKPSVIMWQTNKKQDALVKNMVITDELKDGVSQICLSESKKRLAVMCNDTNHTLVIYDIDRLKKRQQNPLITDRGIIAVGPSSTNIPFDLKFDVSEKVAVFATLRELLFITYQKGVLNANRGVYGNFTVTSALCLQPLQTKYKGQDKQYMLSGMGNGSIYFWQKQNCVKAVSGHNGSVSSICSRKDMKSFVSGDKSGTIIIWNDKFQKQKTITVPKSNCISNMIVSLNCSRDKQLLVGTKSSDIYLLKLGDSFDKANKIMSGHNQGQLWGLVVHKKEDFIYTGGEDHRLMKWDYITKRKLDRQRKCPYPIRSIDLYTNDKLGQAFLTVGYKNGVVQCFDPNTLDSLQKRFQRIKNPDQQVLNLVRVNKDGTMCVACYQYPSFKIALLNLTQKDIKILSEIPVSSKVIAIDFDKQSKHIRFNTANYEYLVYDIDNFTAPKQVKKFEGRKLEYSDWATHTLPFSPQTQGAYAEGVQQSDVVCCERTRKYFNVFVIGDKYSKIKLFNYPSKQNLIYNKYVGHSNQVTGLQFDRRNEHLISIGGEEKSIIVWKYNSQQLKNQWFIQQLAPESDIEQQQMSQQRKKKKALLSQFDAEVVVGQQALATKAFAGQIRPPSDFKQNYNSKRDNQVPEQDISIKHVFGLRNKYLNDEVRNQVKFAVGYKSVVFPTACLGVKMNIETKKQQFYHAHRQDIVSMAIDPTRKLIATGQMAQKNPVQPKKKIVSIYVWDLETKQPLMKLDGFLTIAVVLLSFSPNSKLLFACGNDQKNTFAIYDWMSGSVMYSGPTSRSKVNGIAWKTNEQFMTCGMDHVKFWTGPKSCIGKTDGKVQSMFSCVSSKSIYITGSGDGGIYNWLGNKSGKKIQRHVGKVHTLIFHNDYIYSGAADGKINSWKTKANGQIQQSDMNLHFDTRMAHQELLKSVKSIPQQQYGILSIDFGKSKDQMLIGTMGASIIYCSGKKSQIIHQGHYRGQLWGLTTQVRKNNDNFIITGGDDKSIRLWDIEAKKQITRVYFQDKIRGIDWSPDGSKIVVGDSRAKVYLYNSNLTNQLDKYTGKPYEFNKDEKKIDPFIEDIKFSPNGKMIVYGCHGKSLYMEFLNVAEGKLKLKKTFTQGSSALLHVDWSTDSQSIGINSQAYQLLFYDTNGKMKSASSMIDEKWATWTRKIGFQVKGIFQGVDYSDVNTVCREPDSKFIAVGYDDQCIRLFRYPCYIQKQVHKTYPGHSSHVTRIKFTSQYMVSLGGNDRTIIVWDVHRVKPELKDQGQQSDGLDDLQQDVDLPNKAVTRKQKPKKVQEFYQNQDEGDQFMAVKPWIGAIKQPTYQYPKQSSKKPNAQITLEYVHGYRVKDCRQNLYYCDKQTIIFHAAAVLIYHDIQKNEQKILNDHNDDILSIDYHRPTNQVITGELGPKPLVCLYKDAKLIHTFMAPVKKGVLAIAISPDGKKAACAGMDDDHHVAVLDLQTGKILACEKGTKKVITKIVWTSNNNFSSAGISHYKYWTFDKKLSGKQSPKRYNFVSIAFDPQTKKVYTGASKGTIVVWNGSDAQKPQISLVRKNKHQEEGETQVEQVPTAVVDCLWIQKNLLLAGTKDGSIFVLDKKSKQILKQIQMQDQFTDEPSCCPSIRSIYMLQNKMLVGTLGSQIYEFSVNDLKSSKPLSKCRNILKCHYSPNNTWTNEVWGLHVYDDYILTCSDDATVRCWSISQRKMLSCASTNMYRENGVNTPLQMDKKTNDFTDSAKSRAVAVSPDGKEVIVGSKNGTVRVYSFSKTDQTLILKNVFRHAKQWISDIKFGYNTLIIGSHDNAIYVYDYEQGKIKRKYAPMKKHSSYITHMDVSRDSCFLQSTCGAYELLFWDLNSGKQITAGATMLRDERWATWTCNIGWPVQGIYPKVTDGTFINSVDRSNFSINGTLAKDDPKSPYLVAVGNDNGKVGLYNYPCTIKSSDFVEGKGHSSHVTNVRWTKDDRRIISVGGEDQCLMYWKVNKNKK